MRILCVHQGWELYGSDRTFIQSIRAIRASAPVADIVIDLPRPGPLVNELEEFASEIRFRDMSVLRRRPPLAWIGFLSRLPLNVYRAARRIDKFDVVYINTIVPIDYLLATRFVRTKALVHVHEIPKPSEARATRTLLKTARATYFFNSQATRRSYDFSESKTSVVVHNGTAIPGQAVLPSSHGGFLRVLCIGRFNAWKGQEVLVKAVSLLPREYRRRIQLRFVGDVFEGQDGYLNSIRRSLTKEPTDIQATIEPFADDPSCHYQWCDIVVVPSTRPEPFGLVAIEGMAAARPVIASNHGGIAEVILDAETGRLVQPNSPAELAAAIRSCTWSHLN